MRPRERESVTGRDAHDLLFDGADSADDTGLFGDHPDDHVGEERYSRVGRKVHARRRRRGRVLGVLAAALVVVVLIAGYFIALPIYRSFHPADYSGSGTGRVVVTVHANDGAGDIGTTLKNAGVVASVDAFTDAASDNSRSQNIQPGSYTLRKHMSAAKALALLLDPTAKLDTDVLVPEGVTTLDIEARLIAAPCTATSKAGTICGLGLPQATVAKALANVTALGVPTDFTAGRAPTSAEGFLYPATYPFDSRTSASDALQEMVSRFTEQVRTLSFSASAKALRLTPYQALIIASIAQAEAKFPEEMPMVARVILNRLAAKSVLQIDATSSYACKLAGTPAAKCIYHQVPGPYNTYNNRGLPPTPINNPGADALKAAVHPADGNWLFYVNKDAEGHLFFTNSESAFLAAAAKCRANKWGCG